MYKTLRASIRKAARATDSKYQYKKIDNGWQFKFTRDNSVSQVVVRVTPVEEGVVKVSYTSENLRRKPYFEAVALCDVSDTWIFVEPIISTHL